MSPRAIARHGKARLGGSRPPVSTLPFLILRRENAMNVQTVKAREDRVRRKLRDAGYLLRKSRSRTAESVSFGGYMIVDERNCIVGGGHVADGYSMDLETVEAWLTD
jgi:hypothetical protein